MSHSDFADLHTHTTASDGLETPGELIHLASQAGLAAIAIADHDTVDAHLIIGIGEYLLAYALSRVYSVLRLPFIGSCIIKLCGAAFRHGAGLDDAALMLLDEMGPDARPLLEAEAERPGGEAALLFRIMRRRWEN